MEHATIDITFEELILATTALSYTHDDLKGIVDHADKYEELRLKLHAQFQERRQMDE